MTREQALQMYQSGWWNHLPARDVAEFQLFEERLCMPFDLFHAAIEKALGRPVWTHEFALDRDGLKRELMGDRHPPTFDAILSLIPPEKLVMVSP